MDTLYWVLGIVALLIVVGGLIKILRNKAVEEALNLGWGIFIVALVTLVLGGGGILLGAYAFIWNNPWLLIPALVAFVLLAVFLIGAIDRL